MKEIIVQYLKSRKQLYEYFDYSPPEDERILFNNLSPHIEDYTDHYWNIVCDYIILFSDDIENFKDFMGRVQKHSSETIWRIIERPELTMVVMSSKLGIFRTENRLNMDVDVCAEGHCDDPDCPKSMESWYYHMMKQFSKK